MEKKHRKWKMEACPYERIQILEPYLLNASEKEKTYLLSLDIDRLLAGFEETAGLKTQAERYPGWESTEIQGHTLGHYLASIAQAYAGTGDEEFMCRVRKICERLRKCQREDGYLFAWNEEIFDRVEKSQPAWVPWYTMHKILAGLLTAYHLTKNKIAFEIAVNLGNWVSQRTMGWNEEIRGEVLAVEYGGMNDALYELYQITNDETYLAAAHRFDEEELFGKIHDGNDILNNLHANTTIPKIIGAMKRYLVTGDTYYFDTAKNFWHMVVEHHTYITGGNSEWEHFGRPDILDGERTACNCESCNVYNMLKLTKLLYQATGDKSYMDFYEQAWMNAVLASQNPETGMTMYFQPMETGFFKVYQEPYQDFWCCTGTGMENFTKLQDALYFRKEDALYITRYISSRFQILDWDMEIEMEVHFPETDTVKLQIRSSESRERNIYLRIPDWTENQMHLVVDGEERIPSIENGYLRCVLGGCRKAEIQFFPFVRAHVLPDNPQAAAFTYGPIVLCAGLGKEMLDTTVTGVQVKVPTKKMFIKDYLILKEDTPEKWLEQIQKNLARSGPELVFSLTGTDEDGKLMFVPYYSQYKERYGIYWTLYKENSCDLEKRKQEQEGKKRIEDTAIDVIPIGNDQYELAHKIQGNHTEASWEFGYNYRRINGKGSFQYEIAVNPKGSALAVTYGKYDAGSEFDILVDGRLLVHERLTECISELYTKFYALPGELLGGRKKAVVTFRTLTEYSSCRIFQILYTCDIKQSASEKHQNPIDGALK